MAFLVMLPRVGRGPKVWAGESRCGLEFGSCLETGVWAQWIRSRIWSLGWELASSEWGLSLRPKGYEAFVVTDLVSMLVTCSVALC